MSYTMEYAGLLEQAIIIAVDAHGKTMGKGNNSLYIYHPLIVAMMGNTIEENIVGVLHDVVEDTDVTLMQIETIFGTYISDAIDAITKKR